MIQYEDGERDILLNRLTKLVDMETGSPSDPSTIPYVYVLISGSMVQISLDLLIDLVLWDQSKDPNILIHTNRAFKKFIYLIHFAPLDRVPLFINEIPEVAKWRLEIGK